jgi:hypothetical protein
MKLSTFHCQKPFLADTIMSHAFLGDEVYPLKPPLIRPYPHRNVNCDEITFNRVYSSVGKVA